MYLYQRDCHPLAGLRRLQGTGSQRAHLARRVARPSGDTHRPRLPQRPVGSQHANSTHPTSEAVGPAPQAACGPSAEEPTQAPLLSAAPHLSRRWESAQLGAPQAAGQPPGPHPNQLVREVLSQVMRSGVSLGWPTITPQDRQISYFLIKDVSQIAVCNLKRRFQQKPAWSPLALHLFIPPFSHLRCREVSELAALMCPLPQPRSFLHFLTNFSVGYLVKSIVQ